MPQAGCAPSQALHSLPHAGPTRTPLRTGMRCLPVLCLHPSASCSSRWHQFGGPRWHWQRASEAGRDGRTAGPRPRPQTGPTVPSSTSGYRQSPPACVALCGVSGQDGGRAIKRRQSCQCHWHLPVPDSASHPLFFSLVRACVPLSCHSLAAWHPKRTDPAPGPPRTSRTCRASVDGDHWLVCEEPELGRSVVACFSNRGHHFFPKY